MHKFEIGKQYFNRKGRYTVLNINDKNGTILLEYDDGARQQVDASRQWRIYQNMSIDQNAGPEKQKTSKAKRRSRSAETFSLWDDIVPLVSTYLFAADDWLSSYDLHTAFLETENGKAVLRSVQLKRDGLGKPKDSNENIAKNMVAFFHKSWTEGDEQLRQQFDRTEIDGTYFYRQRH